MKMSKINLHEVRGINDLITVTFLFIRQEFKPLLVCLSVILLPLMLVLLTLQGVLMLTVDGFVWGMGGSLVLTNAVFFYWVMMICISYLSVYDTNYKKPDQPSVTCREVWRVMWPAIGKTLLWIIFYVLLVVLGFLFFIIPGIYFSVAWIFSVYLMIIKNRPLSVNMFSFDFIRGEWWATFGIYLALGIIVGVMSYVFKIPLSLVNYMYLLTGEADGMWVTFLVTFVMSLGQNLFRAVLFVGVGFKFFGILESREHSLLREKIASIGCQVKV